MLRPGREVGNYRIEGLVGRGGQGIVYRAVHVRLGTVHALKMLVLELGPLRDRLLEEGRIQARLRSPHVVPVTDAVEVDGALGLVAEYVHGAPLDAWLHAESPPLEDRLAVFRDVCRGVAAAHAQRIVHRDLKPANVLVERRDGRPFARVTDFGVAKVLGDAQARAGTLPGMALGTPGYMAPEQLRDAATVDARADVFALGCLLHELVTGARPWPESELGPYAFAVETRPPPALGGTYAAELGPLVTACLARDPDARPADAAAVLAWLDGRRPTLPVAPRTPTAVPAGGGVGAAGAEGGAVGAADAVAPPGAGTADDPWAEPPPRPRSWIPVAMGLAGLALAGGVAWGWATGGSDEAATRETLAAASAATDAPPGGVNGAALPAGEGLSERMGAGATSGEVVASAVSGVDVAPEPNGGSPPVGGAAPASAPSTGVGPTDAPAARPSPRATPGGAGPTDASSGAGGAAATAPDRPGRVVLEGDGELVRLEDGARRVDPSSAPPGHYTAVVRFGAEGEVPAGVVSVRAGATSRLKCDATWLRCGPVEVP